MVILNKLKHFLPLNTKVLICNSLILSHLNICILAWGYQCDRIFKLHNNIVRIVSLSKCNAHTEPIFKTLKLLKVYDILKQWELKFYYKYKNKKVPHYIYILKIIQVHIVMQQAYSIVSINISPTMSMPKDVLDIISLGLLRTHQ